MNVGPHDNVESTRPFDEPCSWKAVEPIDDDEMSEIGNVKALSLMPCVYGRLGPRRSELCIGNGSAASKPRKARGLSTTAIRFADVSWLASFMFLADARDCAGCKGVVGETCGKSGGRESLYGDDGSLWPL